MNYEEQCVATVQMAGGGVRRCHRRAIRTDPLYLITVPICTYHEKRARRQFVGRLEDELAEMKAHECAGELAVDRYLMERQEQREGVKRRARERTQAYFIRCGSFVKIGASSSPKYRLETIRKLGGVICPPRLDLQSAELIATEPGGFDREKELHAKFAHLRHTGEWFTEAPELTAYIEGLAA